MFPLVLLAGLAACAAAPNDTVEGSGAATVTLGADIWRLNWQGTAASADFAAGPASRPDTSILQRGSVGLTAALKLAEGISNVPGADDPARADAEGAIMIAQAEQPWCRPRGSAYGTVTPKEHGTLTLSDPRYDGSQGIWIFKGRCDFAAKAS